jgi:deazaflavin-dependent oxidoreductase (nitroreductase family)
MPSASRIPPFDPSASHGPVYRAMTAVLRTGFGRSFAINIAARADPLLLSVTRGRVGMGMVLPTAGLTTTGAKSGTRRTAAVLYFTDADDVILIASNFGRERHPAWYYNLKAHSEAVLERGGRQAQYVASEVIDLEEHARLFGLANSVYPGYEDYRVRTAAVGRRIPIMRCKPLS